MILVDLRGFVVAVVVILEGGCSQPIVGGRNDDGLGIVGTGEDALLPLEMEPGTGARRRRRRDVFRRCRRRRSEDNTFGDLLRRQRRLGLGVRLPAERRGFRVTALGRVAAEERET